MWNSMPRPWFDIYFQRCVWTENVSKMSKMASLGQWCLPIEISSGPAPTCQLVKLLQLLLNLNWKHWPWGHILDQTYECSGQPIIYKYCIIIIFIILYDGTLRYWSRPSVVPVTVSITAMCWLELEMKAIRRFAKVSIVSYSPLW